MLPDWQEVGSDLDFLPIEGTVVAALETDLGWLHAQLPAGYVPGSSALNALDISDFLVLPRAKLPDDVADGIAWVLGEPRCVLECQCLHLPPEWSPVTHPSTWCRSGVSPPRCAQVRAPNTTLCHNPDQRPDKRRSVLWVEKGGRPPRRTSIDFQPCSRARFDRPDRLLHEDGLAHQPAQ